MKAHHVLLAVIIVAALGFWCCGDGGTEQVQQTAGGDNMRMGEGHLARAGEELPATLDARDELEERLPNGDSTIHTVELMPCENPYRFGICVDVVRVQHFPRPGESDKTRVTYAVSEFTMERHKPGEVRPRPLEITRDAATRLVDRLWDMGIRPTRALDIEKEIREIREFVVAGNEAPTP